MASSLVALFAAWVGEMTIDVARQAAARPALVRHFMARFSNPWAGFSPLDKQNGKGFVKINFV
jgi:hypothetical protein